MRPAPAGPGAGAGRGRYVQDTVRALWPEPARVVSTRFWAPAGAAVTEFIVVPNDHRAALLLPRRPLRAAAGALRNYKASADPRQQRRLRALSLAARVGFGELLPSRIRIEHGPRAPGADIADYLSTVLDREVVVSVYIGPPRANRKPVLQVLTPGGELLGFAKISVTDLTRDLVRSEADTLEFLISAPLSYVQVPRLLWHGQWRDHEVLVAEALSGSGRPGDISELADAMVQLAGVCGLRTLAAAESPYWRRLRERLRDVSQRELGRALSEVLGRLAAAAGSTQLTFGSWHGDWTPWNMTMLGGRALVWDWERFATGVPVGYDAMHYQFHGALVRNRITAEAAAEAALAAAPMILPPLGVGPDAARLVALLYLAEIGTRYLHDRQADAGAQLGHIDTWLLPVLTRHADQMGNAG
jgi:Phosphotransferase enzyme family